MVSLNFLGIKLEWRLKVKLIFILSEDGCLSSNPRLWNYTCMVQRWTYSRLRLNLTLSLQILLLFPETARGEVRWGGEKEGNVWIRKQNEYVIKRSKHVSVRGSTERGMQWEEGAFTFFLKNILVQFPVNRRLNSTYWKEKAPKRKWHRLHILKTGVKHLNNLLWNLSPISAWIKKKKRNLYTSDHGFPTVPSKIPTHSYQMNSSTPFINTTYHVPNLLLWMEYKLDLDTTPEQHYCSMKPSTYRIRSERPFIHL